MRLKRACKNKLMNIKRTWIKNSKDTETTIKSEEDFNKFQNGTKEI
jgi:hypothetical protein